MSVPHRHSPLRRRLLMSAAIAAGAGTTPARAQAYPARAVHLFVPQPPGGAADRLARILADALKARWNQTVLVENKPGGGVVVGTRATVNAAPDGLSFGLLGSSLSINAVQRKDLPYDAVKDLQPLARIGYYTMALVAATAFPADDIASLIAMAKKAPGTISFDSNGIGTSAQLAGDMLNHMAGIELLHVPYNGAAKMYNDIVGGQIPMGFSVLSSAVPFIKAGKMKVLGVTSPTRSPLFPQWPAIAETLPGFESVNWAGFAGPAGIDPALVRRISDDVLAVLAEPAVKKQLGDMGIDVAPLSAVEFTRFIGDEITRFAKITRPLTGGK